MRKCLLIPLLVLILLKPLLCQTNAIITDVDFRVENNLIVVNYTIKGSWPEEIFTVQLKFLTEDNQEIIPVTTRGDIGPNIRGDSVKTIFWNFEADKFEYNGVLRASFNLAKTVMASKPLGGPSNAFLSMIVPGLGGYWVYEKKTIPVLTTLSITGLLVYGLLMDNKADDLYAVYLNEKDQLKVDNSYDDANKAHHNSFIAYRLAFGLYITDIIGVAIKGSKNMQADKSGKYSFSGNGINLYYVNNGIQLGYRKTF